MSWAWAETPLKSNTSKRNARTSQAVARGSVVFFQSAGDDIDHHVFADRLGENAEGVGRQCFAQQVVVAVGRNQDHRNEPFDLTGDVDLLAPRYISPVHMHKGEWNVLILNAIR